MHALYLRAQPSQTASPERAPSLNSVSGARTSAVVFLFSSVEETRGLDRINHRETARAAVTSVLSPSLSLSSLHSRVSVTFIQSLQTSVKTLIRFNRKISSAWCFLSVMSPVLFTHDSP